MAGGFLQHVLKNHCEFQVEADRTSTDEIESGIKLVTHDIIKRIEKTAPEFKVSDIIPNGSSYEGTKNEAPNEFDFMLILEKLSGSGKVNLHKVVLTGIHKLNLEKRLIFPENTWSMSII